MKRFVISSIVLISFVAFSLYYRIAGESALSALPPKDNSNSSPTSAPSTNPTITPSPTSKPDVQPTTTEPTSQPQPTNPPAPTAAPTQPPKSGYHDGTFTGDSVDAFYGNIQVQAVIQNGNITDVQFLQYPNDRDHSISINQHAMPILKSEAIQTQSSNVDIVSGATDSSQAFIQSLQSALQKAKS